MSRTMSRHLVHTVVGLIVAAGAVGLLAHLRSEAPQPETAPDSDQPTISVDEFIGEATITTWQRVPDFEQELAILDSVFWEPEDTTSLRELIRTTDLVRGQRILEIGTGSGLIALTCLKHGAASVVATDINPAAVRNAVFNARRLQLLDRLEVRLVPQDSPEAWTVLKDSERFDLIISNPPWEDQKPARVAEYALYDPNFALMKSLLSGLRQRLRPGGRALLAYGCVEAIRRIEELAPDLQLRTRKLDERDLDDLPNLFLPGMLIEVTPEPISGATKKPPPGEGGGQGGPGTSSVVWSG